jgi:prevent-host-death family protein
MLIHRAMKLKWKVCLRLNEDRHKKKIDTKNISEFRANAASLVQQVQRTKRPLVITQQGRSAVVLLDVSEYEKLIAKLELLQDIRTSEEQIEDGQGISHAAVRKKVLNCR